MTDTTKNNYPEPYEEVYKIQIPKKQKPFRIDTFLTNEIKNATRTKVQNAITAGKVLVNGRTVKASRKVQALDQIECSLIKYPPLELIPEDIPLKIAYEDEELMVIDKEPGMCSHPGVGNRYGTLVNAVLYYLGERESKSVEVDDEEAEEYQFKSDEVRPGLVHRLDKDTSGMLIISKNPNNMPFLQSQFSDRSISREYHTLVWGKMQEKKGTIIGDIGRSPRDRKKFAVVKKGGKYAATDYEVIKEFSIASYLRVKLRTGRTHQIRVHFANMNRPLVGDVFYGGDKIPSTNSKFKRDLANKIASLSKRQMLHAKEIAFIHPSLNEKILVTSDLPDDFKQVLEILEDAQKQFKH